MDYEMILTGEEFNIKYKNIEFIKLFSDKTNKLITFKENILETLDDHHEDIFCMGRLNVNIKKIYDYNNKNNINSFSYISIPDDALVNIAYYSYKINRKIFKYMIFEADKVNIIKIQNFSELDYFNDKSFCSVIVRKLNIFSYITNPNDILTEEIIKFNGLLIRKIINVSEKLLMSAITQNPIAIAYFDEPNFDACEKAIKQYDHSILYIKNLSLEKCKKLLTKIKIKNEYIRDTLIIRYFNMDGSQENDIYYFSKYFL